MWGGVKLRLQGTLRPLPSFQHARADPMDIDEVVASLDRKQLAEVWQKLQLRCTRTLLSFNADSEGDEQEEVRVENKTSSWV